MNNDNNFLMQAAAEKAIADLQAQATAAQIAATQAKKSADQAAQTASRWRKLTVALGAAVAVLVVLAGFGVRLYVSQGDATNKLRAQAIASCQIGNDRASGTVTALDELVVLLEGPHPTADVKRRAAAYDAFVLSHNEPRNCPQAYGH